jgi:hypothetical protein
VYAECCVSIGEWQVSQSECHVSHWRMSSKPIQMSCKECRMASKPIRMSCKHWQMACKPSRISLTNFGGDHPSYGFRRYIHYTELDKARQCFCSNV